MSFASLQAIYVLNSFSGALPCPEVDAKVREALQQKGNGRRRGRRPPEQQQPRPRQQQARPDEKTMQSLVNRATPENAARATRDIDALIHAGLDRGVAAGVAWKSACRGNLGIVPVVAASLAGSALRALAEGADYRAVEDVDAAAGYEEYCDSVKRQDILAKTCAAAELLGVDVAARVAEASTPLEVAHSTGALEALRESSGVPDDTFVQQLREMSVPGRRGWLLREVLSRTTSPSSVQGIE